MPNASNTTKVSTDKSVSRVFKAMGPGLLMAAAAIGASHLVASTRAGAEFGWQLAWVILAVNLIKYPFFAAGARYTVATGESLLQGYYSQGRGYLMLFTLLNGVAAVASTAGVAMLTAAMLTLFIPLSIDILALIVLIASLALIILGHYRLLDRLSKVIMFSLTLMTLIAAAMALNIPSVIDSGFIAPSPWQWAYIGFLVAMMGWMPAPIEVSVWNSLWLIEKQKQMSISKAQALFDFNTGYILTTVLALVFLSLGASVMYGSNEHFSDSGAMFASQLIELYSNVMGSESRYLIGAVALLCIFSTTVTVIDGYSRSLAGCWQLLLHHKKRTESNGVLTRIMLLMSLLSLLIILFFQGALLPLLEFVMILAFITTAVFAALNFKLMTSEQLAVEDRYGPIMKLWSWLGIIYFVGFTLIFVYWKYFQ
ncbi:Nramp family divalent metal transporter [Shewanella surugensis]|uniref:Nramp family divalent metal transporter n=1 Tax=Shewanella surugensis TaxID=212020 RepID=A0ABT0L5K1_9GAMM|nr:Nramp family divalent metal transporter [Shewanella surugensis]MCL1122945.1 Nramp family divalent metal transporter [Shewanella surugensis]